MRNKLTFKHEQTETRQENFVCERTEYNEALGAELKAGGYYCQTFKNPETLEAKKRARNKRLSKSLNRQVEKSIATAAGRGYG